MYREDACFGRKVIPHFSSSIRKASLPIKWLFLGQFQTCLSITQDIEELFAFRVKRSQRPKCIMGRSGCSFVSINICENLLFCSWCRHEQSRLQCQQATEVPTKESQWWLPNERKPMDEVDLHFRGKEIHQPSHQRLRSCRYFWQRIKLRIGSWTSLLCLRIFRKLLHFVIGIKFLFG